MVRQACVRGMGEGDFTEEAEWMSWVLEDQLSLGACRDGAGAWGQARVTEHPYLYKASQECLLCNQS